MEYNFIPLVVLICSLIYSVVLDELMIRRYSRKCSYDCEKCRYWPCPAHYCRKKRKEQEEQQNTRHDQ